MSLDTMLQALSDFGWAALFVAAVSGLVVSLHRQVWVPGWAWRSERDGRRKAEAALDRVTDALEAEHRRADELARILAEWSAREQKGR